MGTLRQAAIYKPTRQPWRETKPADTFVLDLHPLELWENIFLWLRPPVYGICYRGPSSPMQWLYGIFSSYPPKPKSSIILFPVLLKLVYMNPDRRLLLPVCSPPSPASRYLPICAWPTPLYGAPYLLLSCSTGGCQRLLQDPRAAAQRMGGKQSTPSQDQPRMPTSPDWNVYLMVIRCLSFPISLSINLTVP